jgi:hypothetical protein
MRPADLRLRLATRRARIRLSSQVRAVEAQLRPSAGEAQAGAPVLFFNASTRIHRLSLNAAFSLLASWAVRAAGTPVTHLVCTMGMQQCPLGTQRTRLSDPPPCRVCTDFGAVIFPQQHALPLRLDPEAGDAVARLHDAPLASLIGWEWQGLPLGQLCLPSLRWVLRRHDLEDSQPVRDLLRQYLASAVSLAKGFARSMDLLTPRALVVFNGIMFPEATARAVASKKEIPVVTHEVGLRSMSAFFSPGDATFRELERPVRMELSPTEASRLDAYLAQRFEGQFSMAGIRFWPEIKPLPESLEARAARFGRTVAVFTNVVFDTSQVHANTLFPSMFSWLEDLVEAIDANQDTLFVVRAHPDEDRPGKESRQSVADWAQASRIGARENCIFVGPSQYLSSYALIQRSSFVLVYNSSIGLEATLLGVPVLCAGRARYTQWPTVTFPTTLAEYRRLLREYLGSAHVPFEESHRLHARRFLHDELFTASIDFSGFVEPFEQAPGMVHLRPFRPESFFESREAEILAKGIVEGMPFRYDTLKA